MYQILLIKKKHYKFFNKLSDLNYLIFKNVLASLLVIKYDYIINLILIKVPQDLNVEKSNTFYCTTCQRYLPSHEFQVSSSSAKMGKCRTCINLENVALKRIDFTKFR